MFTSYISECNRHFFCLEEINCFYVDDDYPQDVTFSLPSSQSEGIGHGCWVTVKVEDFYSLLEAANQSKCFVKVRSQGHGDFYVNAHNVAGIYQESNRFNQIRFRDGTVPNKKLETKDVRPYAKAIMKIKCGGV